MRLILHMVTDPVNGTRYYLRTTQGHIIENVHIEPLPPGAAMRKDGAGQDTFFVGFIPDVDVRSIASDQPIDEDGKPIAQTYKPHLETMDTVIEEGETYMYLLLAKSGAAIFCKKCGMTSHNYNDISERYCANCKTFHKRVPGSGSFPA